MTYYSFVTADFYDTPWIGTLPEKTNDVKQYDIKTLLQERGVDPSKVSEILVYVFSLVLVLKTRFQPWEPSMKFTLCLAYQERLVLASWWTPCLISLILSSIRPISGFPLRVPVSSVHAYQTNGWLHLSQGSHHTSYPLQRRSSKRLELQWKRIPAERRRCSKICFCWDIV